MEHTQVFVRNKSPLKNKIKMKTKKSHKKVLQKRSRKKNSFQMKKFK